MSNRTSGARCTLPSHHSRASSTWSKSRHVTESAPGNGSPSAVHGRCMSIRLAKATTCSGRRGSGELRGDGGRVPAPPAMEGDGEPQRPHHLRMVIYTPAFEEECGCPPCV